MPIRIPDSLPAHAILEAENIFVMTEHRAMHQDIRPLNVLILNFVSSPVPKRRCYQLKCESVRTANLFQPIGVWKCRELKQATVSHAILHDARDANSFSFTF